MKVIDNREIKRARGRPKRFGAYEIEKARKLFMLGESSKAISEVIGCSERTVSSWSIKYHWKAERKDKNQTPSNLENQISRLSKGSVTESKARKIAMLTRSLERLRRSDKRIENKPLPVISNVQSSEIYQACFDFVMSDAYGLYGYQKKVIEEVARYESFLKARQIGYSYALALRCLLRLLLGRDQLVLSASQDQSDILIEHAINHANNLELDLDATSANEMTLGANKIRALPSNMRSVQGFAGDVVLDEFAWQHNQKKIWNAITPSITACGGSITVCSTPYVPGSLFWQIASNYKDKWNHFKRKKITIHDAIAQGMKLPGGIEELRLNYDTESFRMIYECEWAEDGSALLSWKLLEKISVADLKPLAQCNEPCYLGADVGRVNDRTHISVYTKDYQHDAINGTVKYRSIKQQELKNVSFDEQKMEIDKVFDRYNIVSACIDRTGIGMDLSEYCEKKYPNVTGISFNRQIKEKMALGLLKKAEVGEVIIPRDPQLMASLHAVKKTVSGNAITYDAARDERGHADAFWANALALHSATDNNQIGMWIIR